jgi:hypothetical protein
MVRVAIGTPVGTCLRSRTRKKRAGSEAQRQDLEYERGAGWSYEMVMVDGW